MDLHALDWIIVASVILGTTLVATFTNRYMKSVADFLSANRCAGRYMLTIAEGEARLGAMSLIAMFQLYYEAGFTAIWWYFMGLPVGITINLTGWVIYRLRQTRALTLAEFFEMRYGRKFRVFSGMLAFISGVLYFGIFPAVVTNFFIHFCGFPEQFYFLGLALPTFPILMAALLIIALYFTFIGGQIAIMVTDFIQGMFTSIVVIIILVFIFTSIGWGQISETMLEAPIGESLLHPHHTSKHENFDPYFFFIGVFLGFYAYRTSQTSQGYGSAALTPHEGKMGTIIGSLRGMAQNLMIVILPIAALTLLKHPDFNSIAEEINSSLSVIGNEEIRSQMIVPVAMTKFLPIGLKGAFCAVFLAAFITTHNTFLHAWGSTFIQDVVMPLRKKRMEAKKHMRWLRWSIIGVAVFIFLFSLLFRQREHLLLWLAAVSTIYLGGTGAVLIGGLYWKKATSLAAWAATIVGASLAIVGIILRQINPDFFLNGMELAFWISFVSSLVYIFLSLADRKHTCNMDKLLHRKEYAVQDDIVGDSNNDLQKESLISKLGLTKEFSKCDRVIYFTVAGWSAFLFTIFVIGTIYNLAVDVSEESWSWFWSCYVKLVLVLGIPVTIWITLGGIRDMIRMFKRLKDVKRNAIDDGWVDEHLDKDSIN